MEDPSPTPVSRSILSPGVDSALVQKYYHTITGGSEIYTHASLHKEILEKLQFWEKRYRNRIGLEHFWAIELLVLCSDQMQDQEASVTWDAEVWYARMSFRCSLSDPLLEWCLVHELCELQRWRSANAYLDAHQMLLQGDQTQRLIEQFRIGRNQEIELQVAALLGHRRPYHLLAINE